MTMGSIGEFNLAWAKDSSVENGWKVWWALYGQFDLQKEWDISLQKQFMEEYDWSYEGREDSQHNVGMSTNSIKMAKRGEKGCIAKLIYSTKNQMVKNLNDAARSTHGQMIGIMWPGSEIHTEEKKTDRRRTRGLFYPLCIREHDGWVVVDEVGVLAMTPALAEAIALVGGGKGEPSIIRKHGP